MSDIQEIDPSIARELRAATSMSWREIATLMSRIAGRSPPFQAVSISAAVARAYGTPKTAPRPKNAIRYAVPSLRRQTP